MIKQYENKCVYPASTFSRVAAAGTVKRSDAKQKSYIDVSLPDMVLNYNTFILGVDLADMLITLYRTKIMVKKCWYLQVIFQALDIYKINELLLYRCLLWSTSSSKKNIYKTSLLAFILELTEALRFTGKSNSKLVGGPKNWPLSLTPSVGEKAAVAKLLLDVRYDLHNHFLDFNEKRGRCYRPSGYNNIYCRKCNNVLCSRKSSTCFTLNCKLYLNIGIVFAVNMYKLKILKAIKLPWKTDPWKVEEKASNTKI